MLKDKEQGSAVLLTVIVTVVILFLAGALGLFASVEGRRARAEEASMQAYYLARSGADAMAQAIIDDPTLLDDPVIKSEVLSEKVRVENGGSFAVKVIRGSGVVRVQSVGMVGDQQRTVELTLLSVLVPFDHAVAAVGGSDGNVITLNGGDPTVTGDIAVYAGNAIDGEDKLKGEIITLSAEVKYPVIVFPDLPTVEPHYAKKLDNTTIDADVWYDSIETFDTLRIDLKKGTRVVRVGTLNLGGSLELINVGDNGRLLLFVENIKGDLILNWEGEGKDDPRALTLYYSGVDAFKMTNDQHHKITGNVVVAQAKAEVDITGGNLNGNLFAMGSEVKISGNPDGGSSLIYAPNARVEMTGGSFVGAVIAKTFEAKGTSTIVFPEGKNFVETFPEGIFGPDFGDTEGSGYRRGIWSAKR